MTDERTAPFGFGCGVFGGTQIAKALEDTRAAEQRQAQARQAKKESFRQIFEENRVEQEMRRQKLAEEQAADLRRNEEYARVLEEQERKRKQALDDFMRKQAELGKVCTVLNSDKCVCVGGGGR